MNMWSTKYSDAAKQSYYLRYVRNGDRGEGNEELIEFVLRQMKTAISLFGALIFYIYGDFIPFSPSLKGISDVADPLIGSLFVFFFGIFITSAYTGCYDMLIRTIVQCNFIDEEMFVGEQKFTEPFLEDLMNYWKKNDDDDLMNANAKREKKKDLVKDKLNLDDQYKVVPEGEEEIDYGPSSEEDENAGNDLFTENKRRKFNSDQDFDDDFLKPKAKKEEAKVNPLAETSITEKKLKDRKGQEVFNVAADQEFDDPEDNDKPEIEKKINEEESKKKLDKHFKGSDESFELEGSQRPKIIINERKDTENQPKPILKTSKVFDDNVSMKSSLSKKKKNVEIREDGSAAKKAVEITHNDKPEIIFNNKDDDNVSISKMSKKSALKKRKDRNEEPYDDQRSQVIVFNNKDNDNVSISKMSKKSALKKNNDKPQVEFKNRDDQDNFSIAKSNSRPKVEKKITDDQVKSKPQELTVNFRSDENEDNINDNASAKVSIKGKKRHLKDENEDNINDNVSAKVSIRSRKNNEKSPMKPSDSSNPIHTQPSPYGKIKIPNNKPKVNFKNDDDDDNPFATPLPTTEKPRIVIPKREISSSKQNPLDKVLNKPTNRLNQNDFEDDFLKNMENVVDKKEGKIEIMNASQGRI